MTLKFSLFTVDFYLKDILQISHKNYADLYATADVQTMEFFLNEAQLSLNSVNSGNLINH